MSDEKPVKILFTSVGRRVELLQAFAQAAARIGCRVLLYGADTCDTAPALRFCHRAVQVPPIAAAEYIPFLLRFCAEWQIDAVIPTIDTDLLQLAQNRARFEALGTKVWIADAEKIALCRDKRKTAAYFRAVGLSSPEPVDDYRRYTGGFPAFIKPRDGSSAVNAYRVGTADELAFLAAHIPQYIVQPFVAGEEYTVDAFCDYDGNPVYITPRRRLAVRAGEVLKTKIAADDTAVAEMRRLLADFKPRGAITVQYIKETATGKNRYIEINPRFGGGAPLSMAAGADSAAALLRLLCGEKQDYCPGAAAADAVYARFDWRVCLSHGAAPIKAVVLDLDDTLFDERDYMESGFRRVAKFLGNRQLTADLWAAWEKGKPPIDTLLESLGRRAAADKPDCVAVYRTHQPALTLLPERAALLADLRHSGIQTGIITDGRPQGQRAKITALGLDTLVDEIIVTDELGGTRFRKPCDIAFRMMQCKCGVPFENMLYVGDNAAKDFDAPRRLGMQTLYYKNPNGIYPAAAFGAAAENETDDWVAFLRQRLWGEKQ